MTDLLYFFAGGLIVIFWSFLIACVSLIRARGARMNEPVAYINIEERMLEWVKPMRWETPTVVKMDKVPLYTTPPKREWVGLTDEERTYLAWESSNGEHCVAMTEAKLKEKNEN